MTAPSSLTATASGGPSAALSWTDNDTSATGYTILRSVDGGSYTTLATLNTSNSASICTFAFSDTSGDAGTATLNCVNSGLGDASVWSSSGAITITSSSDTTDMPLGTYPLIANSAPSLSTVWSPNGAFSFDNLIYPGNTALGGTSYLTNGGVLFGKGGSAIEINIWGNGGGDYAIYGGYGSSNYPIAINSGGTISALAMFNPASSYTDSTVTIGNTYDYEIVAFNATSTSLPSPFAQITFPAAASKLVYSVQPTSVIAGVAESPSIVVDVEDQYGNIVTSDASNVTLAVAGGPGGLSGTVTVAASTGVATFNNIILDTAGDYTLTASDGGLTSATSNGFTVNPASASQIVYSVQPSNVVAGVAESPSIVVDVEDQYGNIVTNDASNVTLAVAGGPGGLSGTVAATAISGIATFSNIILDTAGNYTLTASDGGLASATSSSFTVNPAAASKVAYRVQPSNLTAGVAESPSIVVDVEDQYGNIATGDSSNVTLAIASGPGGLRGTVTATVNSGIATFSNIILDTAGDYTLTASDGSLTSAISSSFTVNPATASKVVYSVQPGNVTVGAVESPSIVVDVEDQYGNLVQSDNSTVRLAVASGPGSISGTVTAIASGGIATFSNIILSTAGNYTLTASDGSLAPATSNRLTVNPDGTTSAITSSVNASVFGQSVTFTATITANTSAAGIPIGSVTFKDGSTVLGSASLDGSGVATLSTTGLAIGVHSISVIYGGDTNFTASTSSVLTEVVNPSPATVTIAASAGTIMAGQLLTLSATITTPGAGLPAGTVMFLDGSTPIGTATLDSAGIATFSTSDLGAGSHNITAVFGTIASAPLPQIVSSDTPVLTNLYRLYNRFTGNHILTTSQSEYIALARHKWTQEGITCGVYSDTVALYGVAAKPLYRLYNRISHKSLWTSDAHEYNVLTTSAIWKFKSIDGYVMPTQIPGTVAMYRVYDRANGQHLITSDRNEYQRLCARHGWVSEGIVGYTCDATARS